MKVVFWGALEPEYELYCPHFMGVKTALKEVSSDFLFLCCRSDPQFVKKTIEFKPDLVICGLPDPINQFFPLENVRHKLPDAKIVFWYGDLRTERTNNLRVHVGGLLDAMFVSNDGQSKFWRENLGIKDVFFLPLACEPEERRLFDPRFAFNAVFIGAKSFSTEFHKRAMLINRFEKLGVKRLDSQISHLRKQIYEHMPIIYSSSKIALDISHYTNIQGYTSVRYWEIPAMWGFALTKRFPGCEDFYPESTRVYFTEFEEAEEKINFYLEHEDERKKMIGLAHKHSYNHTHKKRFEEMFRVLELK